MIKSVLARFSAGLFVAGLLFVALLGLTEAVLRVAGYGHDTRFWREEVDAQGVHWARENPYFTIPFFSKGLTRHAQPFKISVKKPANTVRIFVLGSSAAMGDPEASFGMSRILEQTLTASVKGVSFEVVNAGITAINSNVVRRVAIDCAALEPDFYLVYEGNNEVIGPFGPGTVLTGSLQRPWAVHLVGALKSLRLGQWLADVAARRRGDDPPEAWGGMTMFLGQKIASGDSRLLRTSELFQANLEDIAKEGKSAGAAVVLATVITNERDFAPFLSQHSPRLAPTVIAEIAALESKATDATSRKAFDEAHTAWAAVIARDPGYAEAWFQAGRTLLAEGKPKEASQAFKRARDEDLLRFRTDTPLNEAIRKASGRAGATLLDLDTRVVDVAKDGIPGDDLFYEHVHLSFRGNYWVATEFAKTVLDALEKRLPIVRGPFPTVDDLRRRLGFTVYDQAMILSDLLQRFRKPPFTAQSDQAARLETYSRLNTRVGEILKKPETVSNVEAVYEDALGHSPNDWVLARNYGMALVSLGKPAKAETLLRNAYARIPDDVDLLYSLARCCDAQSKKEEARRYALELQQAEPRYPGLAALLGVKE